MPPLQVIEATDPLTDLIRLETSPVHELIISLHTLLEPGRHTEWVRTARAALPTALLVELQAVYEPFYKGALFFELAVDYPDQGDVPGFIEYVRDMNPADFMFYLVGRIISREEIAQTGLEPEALYDALRNSPYYSNCLCLKAPLDPILRDVPAFQHRLADLWTWYWDAFFSSQLELLRPQWARALDDKAGLLARLGGQGLYEHVTGKQELPEPLPADWPVTRLVFVPMVLMPVPVYIFYGYGSVIVLFDSARTEARRAELERERDEVLAAIKALGDSTRLDILRLIARSGGELHGKQIAAKLNLSASAVSRHLAQLKDAGLIAEESQDNRTITYTLQVEVVKGLCGRLMDVLYH